MSDGPCSYGKDFVSRMHMGDRVIALVNQLVMGQSLHYPATYSMRYINIRVHAVREFPPILVAQVQVFFFKFDYFKFQESIIVIVTSYYCGEHEMPLASRCYRYRRIVRRILASNNIMCDDGNCLR
jgi:hypothetical protein